MSDEPSVRGWCLIHDVTYSGYDCPLCNKKSLIEKIKTFIFKLIGVKEK